MTDVLPSGLMATSDEFLFIPSSHPDCEPACPWRANPSFPLKATDASLPLLESMPFSQRSSEPRLSQHRTIPAPFHGHDYHHQRHRLAIGEGNEAFPRILIRTTSEECARCRRCVPENNGSARGAPTSACFLFCLLVCLFAGLVCIHSAESGYSTRVYVVFKGCWVRVSHRVSAISSAFSFRVTSQLVTSWNWNIHTNSRYGPREVLTARMRRNLFSEERRSLPQPAPPSLALRQKNELVHMYTSGTPQKRTVTTTRTV